MKKLRVDNDEKAEDMAKKLGVSKTYISSVETGKRNIPQHWFDQISGFYTLTNKQKLELTALKIYHGTTSREKKIFAVVWKSHLGANLPTKELISIRGIILNDFIDCKNVEDSFLTLVCVRLHELITNG